MQYTPPQASKFGNSASELTTKKFENAEKYAVSITTQSKNIITTQTVNTSAGNLDKLEGKVNLKYADKSWGDSSIEFDTKGKAISNTTLNKLAPGLNLALRLEFDTTAPKADAVKKCPVATQLTAQYKQECVAATVEYNQKKNQLIKALSLGYEGFSVGGVLTTKLATLQTDGFAKSVSVNGGLQYEDRNLTGTCFLESNNNIGVSIFHNINKETQVGAKVLITSKTGRAANSIALAGQYQLNPATLCKGKVQVFDDKSFNIGSFVEHKLVNPSMTVGVSTTWDSAKQRPVFGVNAAFSAK